MRSYSGFTVKAKNIFDDQKFALFAIDAENNILIPHGDLNGYNGKYSVSFEDIHGDYLHSARIKMLHTYVISI